MRKYKDKRKFSRTADMTHKKNETRANKRGGYRL